MLIVLFSVALLTGFTSVANTKPIFASSIGGIDLGDLTGPPGNGGGNGLDGPQGEQGSGGNDGRDNHRWDGGDRGNDGRDNDRDDSGTSGEPIGFLNIKKNVLGDNRPASDFRLNIEGNNPSKTAVAGSPDGVDVIVGEGDYKVSEQPITGYTTAYSEGCEGT